MITSWGLEPSGVDPRGLNGHVFGCMCDACVIGRRRPAVKKSKDCPECEGEGRWYDASHAASRRCHVCKGTGKRR